MELEACEDEEFEEVCEEIGCEVRDLWQRGFDDEEEENDKNNMPQTQCLMSCGDHERTSEEKAKPHPLQ